jgi:plasmid maintenance system antidote protein VapI
MDYDDDNYMPPKGKVVGKGKINITPTGHEFETASEYVVDKNKELYQRFSPDWASPTSDTVKDILEELGMSIAEFKHHMLYLTNDWHFEHMDAFLEGKLRMTEEAARALTLLLGSTTEFWLKRDEQHWLKLMELESSEHESIHKDVGNSRPLCRKPSTKILERIISQCLSAQVKMFDVPYSASSHLNAAIAALSELIPDYNPDDEEMRLALEWAISEGKILRGEE